MPSPLFAYEKEHFTREAKPANSNRLFLKRAIKQESQSVLPWLLCVMVTQYHSSVFPKDWGHGAQ